MIKRIFFGILMLASLAQPVLAADNPFMVMLQVYSPALLSEETPFEFPTIQPGEQEQVFVLQAGNQGAAQLNFGQEGAALHAVVAENNLILQNGSTSIEISDFKLAQPNTPAASNLGFNFSGNQPAQSLGATAKIPKKAQPGLYEGKVTLRLSYL